MRSNGDGTTLGDFRLPDAQADMLRTVLEGYASPRRQRAGGSNPGSGDSEGTTTRGRPLGAPNTTAQPENDERPSHVTLAPDHVASDYASSNYLADPVSDAPYDGVHAAGLGAGAFRAGEADTTPTTLRYDQRLGLALCELLEHVPLDSLPQAGGLAATITVSLDYQQLLDGLGAATLSTGTKMSAGQARRLACGAGIVPLCSAPARYPSMSVESNASTTGTDD